MSNDFFFTALDIVKEDGEEKGERYTNIIHSFVHSCIVCSSLSKYLLSMPRTVLGTARSLVS